ncbi:hypothetical protein CARUB_v10028063mg [Capsella rubella]|uniref:Uncharacterized protein n=1 Tax=Capsella rubella TaxID=81985 RepID=R0F0H3_9BRAS|nr:uncharacterized protein LOC17875140 [Capsella rubella]EOA14766.1 hypothetical protein CARUB_v10028063mg [Capsella rubella]
MGIRIGGGEEVEALEKRADAVTVTNLGSQKQAPMSPSFSSYEPVKASYGSNGEEEEEYEWVAVDKEVDFVTDKAPELDEVDDAFSALRLMFNDDDDDEGQVSESESVDWIEPPLQLCNTRLLQPYMLDRLYDAFHVFQTDPSVQRMVMSLASDKAVWDAVMNNEVVRELISNVGRSEEDSGSAANCCIRRLFERSAIKIMDTMERVTKYVTDLFSLVPGNETVVLASGTAPVIEKLQMTVLLTIVVLLIVLVTRVTRGR